LSDVAEFKKTIRYTELLTEIEMLANGEKKTGDSLTTLRNEIDALREAKSYLLSQAQDESRGADLVNLYLEHFFGHKELRLIADGEKDHVRFKIKRDKEEARNLSEGECSLISFCYFI